MTQNDQPDADSYLLRIKEYRVKANDAPYGKVKAAYEAVVRELEARALTAPKHP